MTRMILVLGAALFIFTLSVLMRDGVLLLGGILLAGISLAGIAANTWTQFERRLSLTDVYETTALES